MKATMFDGHAKEYDQWFMENEKVFLSELKLIKSCLKDLKKDRVLSVGCGSGLFESFLLKDGDLKTVEGIEPSKDMAKIAEARGIDVKIGDAETFPLEEEVYDIIYFNGSSTYIPNLDLAYGRMYKALKPGGHLILIDVPGESAYGILYSFADHVGSYDAELFDKLAPALPYPIDLVTSGVFYTTPDKVKAVEKLGMKNIQYRQTLTYAPVYTNDQVEEPIEGYGKGGYVAVIAEK